MGEFAGSARTAVAAVLDSAAWRDVGTREYRFFTESIRRQPRMERMFCRAVGTCCVVIGLLNVGIQGNPLGPHGAVQRLINLMVTLSCLVAGLWWVRRSWPSRGGALAFVVWVDLASVTNVWAIDSPEARFGIACIISFGGLYASVALGWRVVAAHCMFGVVYIAGLVWLAVAVEGRVLWPLMPFVTVPLTVVVAVPGIVQFIVEMARREAQVVTAESTLDPLTGVLNRRGWRMRAQRFVGDHRAPGVVVVAVLDIDDFKQVNDGGGHAFGDAVLRAMAQRLVANRDVASVARLGGDEFVVAARLPGEAQLPAFAACLGERLFADRPTPVTVSVGVAYVAAAGAAPTASDLEVAADRAMYTAKRAGGDGYVVVEHRAA
ncbi:GGDEF domain-containing protein [Tsukamurella soli]|uniref:GGDEF domain-containing protein n=1 Tax=Tsukamurella soli TaxID=644556 RepID=A0ABP8JW57_9ACTN